MPAITGTPTSPATTPVGPKPGSPRNVTIEKMAQGWVISWLSPINKTVPVAYYRIEFKEGDGSGWQYSEPIARDTAFLGSVCFIITYHYLSLFSLKLLTKMFFLSVKNLDLGTKYTFRVWAYSILGVGEVSAPLEYKIPGIIFFMIIFNNATNDSILFEGPGDGLKGSRAITAGIVGSVLFFVTAIVLSVCVVKICNKRKRRKMEKGL